MEDRQSEQLRQKYEQYFDLQHIEELHSMVWIWKNYMPRPIYREACFTAFEFAETYKVKHCIMVMLNHFEIKMMGKHWVTKFFFQQLLAAGVTRIALVLPRSLFGTEDNEEIIDIIRYNLNSDRVAVKTFENLQHAKEWVF